MRLVFFSVTVVAVFLGSACGTSSTTVTSPSLDRCTMTVANSMSSVGASGGNGRLTVTAGRECVWSVTSNVSWITPSPPARGQGDGIVTYVVAANPTADVRRGTVATGGQTLEVVQEGLTCQFVLQPGSQKLDADGGTDAFAVEGPIGCDWTPTASDDWITIIDGGHRTANGSVNFRIPPNTGARREGRINVGGQVFAILQEAAECRFQLSATNRSVGAAGGTGTVTVTAPRNCTWAASANVPWISITDATSGSGNGTLRFAVQANPAAARVGVLTIGGQRYTVTQQQAECNDSISPDGQTFSAAGGHGTVTISTSSICTWNTGDVPVWVTGVPASGSGPQTINFNVAANTGVARSANILIGGLTFVVSQASGCSVSLAPGSHDAPASGGASSFAVNTSAGCDWTSSNVPSWVTGIPPGGTGSTLIEFTIDANPSSLPRGATITFGGQTFTVAQAGAACTYSLSSKSYSASASRESSRLGVNTKLDCPWTSSDVPSWVKGIPASGTGATSFTFTVAANTSSSSRTARMTIAGRNFTVSQAGED